MSDDFEDDYDDYDYEDDDMPNQESLPMNDLPTALKGLRDFIASRPGEMAWGVITDISGDIYLHTRWNQPCYGEMRPYGKTHGMAVMPESQRNVGKPGDLSSPFPDGTPLAIGVSFFRFNLSSIAQENEFRMLFLDKEKSPWRDVLKDFDVVTDAHKLITGMIIKDVNVDPTLMVNLFMTMRGLSYSAPTAYFDLRKEYPDEDPYVIFLASAMVHYYKPVSYVKARPSDYYASKAVYHDPVLRITGLDGYNLATDTNLKNFLSAVTDPSVSEGGTFAMRYAYNRPDLHNIFGHTGQTFYKFFLNFTEGTEFHPNEQGHCPLNSYPKVFEAIKALAA